MHPLPETLSSASGRKSPSPADILHWCAASRPALWFPSEEAVRAGIPRSEFDEPLWLLRQAGLVKVGDWVRGRGQGFVLTAAGEEALNNPKMIPALPSTKTQSSGIAQSENWIPQPETKRRSLLGDGEDGWQSIQDESRITTFDRGEAARAALLGPGKMLITTILLGMNVAWFLVGLAVAWRMQVGFGAYFKQPPGDLLLRLGAVSGSRLLAEEWWRLLTCCFVHIGGLHLLANMIALLILGPMAEAMWGRWRYLVIYLISGISGSSLAMATEPDAILAGASGSIWGLMTAIIVWLLLRRSHLPAMLLADRLRSLILVLLVNAALSSAPGLSWQGHLGGGLAGVVLAFLLDWIRPGLGWRGVGALVAVLLFAASGPLTVEIARQQTESWQQLQRREFLRMLAMLEPVAGDDLMSVHRELSYALIRLTPESLDSGRAMLRDWESRMLTAQQGSMNRWPAPVEEQIHAYFGTVDRYLLAARERIDDKRRPTVEEWRLFNQRFDQARQQWDQVVKTADQTLNRRLAR